MYCEKMQQGRVCIDGTYYSAHRLAWFYMVGEWPDGEIDHINGEKSDNRFANFRDVPRSINQQNIRKSIGPNSENRLLGTSYNKRTGRWIAKIALNKKQYGLGYFDTMEEAHEVYLAAKRKMHPGCTI